MSDAFDEQDEQPKRIPSLCRIRGEEMSFMEHLEELRGTLVKCTISYLLACGLLAYFIKDAILLLNWPMEQAVRMTGATELRLIFNSPMGGFTAGIQLIFFGGLVLAMPFLLFFFAQFVAPALNPNEIKALRPTCLAILALFLFGCEFSYFILTPGTLAAAITMTNLFGYDNLWTADSYYSLLTFMTVGVGLTFEFPLVLLLLVKIGILTGKQLLSWWRYSAVFFLLFAAIITPTTDPLTFLMLAVPLFALYLVASVMALGIDRKKAEAAAVAEAEFN